MNSISIICKKELASFFDSLVAYIIIIVFLGLSGFFTWLSGSDVFFIGQATLQGFFGISYWTLFFFIPAITMRTLAEENKSGTIELLSTKPITEFQIVLGKWLAAWVLIILSLLPTLIYYISVANIGPIDHGATIGGYISLILLSAVYISIGIYASSITNNQIVAFILALFIAFFFQFLIDQFNVFLSGGISDILNYMSLNTHYTNMSRGVIDLRDVIYLGSITLTALLLATASIKRRFWS